MRSLCWRVLFIQTLTFPHFIKANPMRLEANLSCAIASALVGTTMLFSSTALGQCDLTSPPGTIITTDGCAHLNGDIDSNGGCNQAPAAFTDLGALGSGATKYVSGEMGLYIPTGATTYTSRDLDWMLVSCLGGTVQIDLSTRNSAGTGQMPNSLVFIKPNVDVLDPCLGNFNPTYNSTVCPNANTIVGPAGTHLIVVSVPFDTTAGTTTAQGCGTYLLKISHTPFNNPICGTSTESCTEPHATGGCNLPACCEDTCNFNPICCDTQWDQNCVDQAVTSCGLFVYSCVPPAGAPANDCATASQLITVGQANVIADNTNAGSDGPGAAVTGQCASASGKDLWYTIKAPANGALTFTACASGTQTSDSVFSVYGLGTDPIMTPTRAQTLPTLYIGCQDDCSATNFASGFTLVDAVANNYYMVRVGGYVAPGADPSTAVTFSLPIVTSFEYVVYTTGAQQYVVTTAGVNTNLGLSSGCTAATSQQRWMAQPFSVPTTAASYDISRMTVKGFAPAGVTNTTMNYVVWNRAAGNPAPVAADQRIAGSVPFPTPYDTAADNAATASHDIVAAFNLPSGDYYLTAYASNPACATTFSNFAWFICAYNGINLLDTAGAPFAWRSATVPTPGFVKYTGLNGAYVVQTGADPNDLYNTAFDIYGTPNGVAPPACPGDYNIDGFRNGADLATLLSAWGTVAGDINGDGLTNGADLSVLLSGWGTCPI